MYISLITARRWFVAQSQVPNLFYIGKCLTIPIRVYRTKVYREKRVSPANFSLIAIGDLLALIYFDGRVYRCMYTAIGRLFTKERNPPLLTPTSAYLMWSLLPLLFAPTLFDIRNCFLIDLLSSFGKLMINASIYLWQTSARPLSLMCCHLPRPSNLAPVLKWCVRNITGSLPVMSAKFAIKLVGIWIGRWISRWWLRISRDFNSQQISQSVWNSLNARGDGGESISFYWYINVRRDGWIVANQGL